MTNVFDGLQQLVRHLMCERNCLWSMYVPFCIKIASYVPEDLVHILKASIHSDNLPQQRYISRFDIQRMELETKHPVQCICSQKILNVCRCTWKMDTSHSDPE